MGKLTPSYSDSEDDTSSSVENTKKKKRKLSIFKYARCNFKKKKTPVLSKSEPSESDFLSRSRSRSILKMTSSPTRKLVGILKHTVRESSDDDEDMEPHQMFRSQHWLVGQVPRPPGTKPGRGGGVAILVRKNVSAMSQEALAQKWRQWPDNETDYNDDNFNFCDLSHLSQNLPGQQSSTGSTTRRKPTKRLSRKQSF